METILMALVIVGGVFAFSVLAVGVWWMRQVMKEWNR